MPKNTAASEKPRSREYRPELIRLPDLNPERLAYREKWVVRCRKFIRRFTRATVTGLEHFPQSGPALLVANHLGDADAVLGLAGLPVPPDALGKVELYNLPFFGKWLDRYGVIWIHRGMADRKAIRCALDGLSEGRFVAIAPEGRQSVTGALEEATGGAAFIALRAGVPVVPMAFVGTEDRNVYLNLLRFRKPVMSLSVGPSFTLEKHADRSTSIEAGTRQIMERIADLLPESYQGVYQGGKDRLSGSQ